MPVYTYRCESCGVQFERFQKFEEQPLAWCPECKKKALRKVYTPVGILFKGSGFYATDHRSPSGQTFSNSSSEKSGDSKDSKSEAKSETKSDSKPAENSSSSPKTDSKSS